MRFILKIIEFGGVGIGIFLIRDNGFIHDQYISYYNNASASIQAQIPQEYVGVLQIFAFISWVLFATIIWFALSKLQRAIGMLEDFRIYFADEANIFYQKYLNDRLHEIHKKNHKKFETDTQLHEQIIVSALYKLRHALMRGYKNGDLRLTLMIPQLLDDDKPKLYIEYWANEEQRTPMTKSASIGFGEYEGFAGRAWRTHKIQVGGKRKFIVLPDPRYIITSVDQDSVRSFC